MKLVITEQAIMNDQRITSQPSLPNVKNSDLDTGTHEYTQYQKWFITDNNQPPTN